jgi:hypothetical protein
MNRTFIVCGLFLIGYTVRAKDTATARASHVQDNPCSHPISPQVWAIMTPNQRRFQQLADTFTQKYIQVVFGSGPYPPCLYQSVRDYFVAVAGATPAERDLADRRRNDALALMRILQSAKREN